MLPYWDSTLDEAMGVKSSDTVIFTEKFLGNPHGSVSVPFQGWIRKIMRRVGSGPATLFKRTELTTLFNDRISYSKFLERFEILHNRVHGWVGGDMNNLDISPFDPIFYMHHAFIDCMWEIYRDRQKQEGQNPENYPDDILHSLAHQSSTLMANLPPFNNVNLTNADGYKNFWMETYYTCAPQPSCSAQQSKCGSKWLDCDIFEGKCVSKGSAAALPRVTPGDVFEIHNRRFPTSSVNNGFNRKLPLPQGRKLNFQSGASGRPGPTGVSTGVSGRKITAEEFFSALKTLKKQSISISNTPIFRNQPGAPGNPGSPGISSSIKTPHSSQQMPSIDELKIPKFQKPCAGNPIQNTFRLDCGVGKRLWVFVPVKVVNLRHGDTVYPSYPVNLEGRTLNDSDLFSDGQPLAFASNLHSKARSKKKSCIYDKSGLFKVRVSSYGLNYYGIYEDTVFLDNKRSVSTEISYIGIKNPEQNATKVFITAVDECGIACQPMILIPGRQKRRFFRYRKSPGAIEITAKGKQYYSNTYRGAESLVWSSAKFSVPQQDENQIPIVFVCDYRKKNPWS